MMEKTLTWQQYEQGIDYKTRINLFTTVDRNERFFAGDQWFGIPREGLPTPVLNFIKYSIGWKTAAISDRAMAMQFSSENIIKKEQVNESGDTYYLYENLMESYANQITEHCKVLWERLKMDYLKNEVLKQAAITGDGLVYCYWNPDIKTGQAHTGDIDIQIIDNVNYFPADPTNRNVQEQPYIILAYRDHIDRVFDKAKRNGVKCKKEDFQGDSDTEYTSGDRGKIEIENTRVNVLKKLYKKDGIVWEEESTRKVIIQPAKSTKLERYPVALMNWETRNNSCHGESEVTSLIPNQVFVNKMLALAMLSQLNTATPKAMYDQTRIKKWTNRVGAAQPVNGTVDGAAMYLNPASVSFDATRAIESIINRSMQMIGAHDITLGNIPHPENTSAFIAVYDAATQPLQLIQGRFEQFIEDIGLIWLDFIKNYYKTGRIIYIEQDGQKIPVEIDAEALKEAVMTLKIDVGESNMWSVIKQIQTLDNLLAAGQIKLSQYLKRIPKGAIPLLQQLIEEAEQQELMQEQIAQQQMMLQQPM